MNYRTFTLIRELACMAMAVGSSLPTWDCLITCGAEEYSRVPGGAPSTLRFNPRFPKTFGLGLSKTSKIFSTTHVDSAVAAKQETSGLAKCCRVSNELQRIIGESEAPRHQVVKLVWKYIRENNLQDPNDKRSILCNAELGEVLGVQKTDMFELSKLLSKHLTYDGSTVSRSKGAKSNGINSPARISEELKSFLATNETHISRTEVVKRMWDYIKANNLQDPADRRKVICDAKLRKLLQCETLLGISITKYLAPHFIRD